jgi:hypothetical protein
MKMLINEQFSNKQSRVMESKGYFSSRNGVPEGVRDQTRSNFVICWYHKHLSMMLNSTNTIYITNLVF